LYEHRYTVNHGDKELLTLADHSDSAPVFYGIRAARSLVFCIVFCRHYFSFHLCFLLAIVLSVLLRFIISDYPVDISNFSYVAVKVTNDL